MHREIYPEEKLNKYYGILTHEIRIYNKCIKKIVTEKKQQYLKNILSKID